MTDNQSLIGNEISGCEIISKVAEGGMGSVFRARHKALNRIVCVKILSPALANDKKAVELFLTEARAIAELDHPNIVNVYNVGKEKGYYFIVMSFIEGQTLSMMLKKQKVLPVGLVLDLFEGVLQGLGVAHEKGIIHRDIKPSNILINLMQQPKIVDFGIAKKVDKEKGSTKTTELAGTAYFIAPEQALGKDIDTRADLYSVGASMYYVLTGQFPYNGKNTIDIIQKHINEPVPDPAKIRRDLPGWLSLAIQKLMSKKPDNRFQTAKEVCTYFTKMRAEEQLRVKTGRNGAAIDLGVEGPLRLAQEERLTTESVKNQRAQQAARQLSERISQPSQRVKWQMPKIEDAISPDEQAKLQAAAPSRPTNAEEIQISRRAPRSVTDTLPKQLRAAAPLKPLSPYIKIVRDLIFFLPLFLLFASGVMYAFFSLGKICSVYVSTTAGFFSNFFAPWIGGFSATNQLTVSAIAVVLIAFILMSSVIRAFARSTATLLSLAFVAYLAGLFTPQVPFMDISSVTGYLFSPEYYLGYFLFALTWTALVCLTPKRSLAKRFLGAGLLFLTVVLAYSASYLSLRPELNELWPKLMFYMGLLSALLSLYYLAAKSERDAQLLPLFFMLVSVVFLWSYNVTGLAQRIDGTMHTLTSNIVIEKASIIAEPLDSRDAVLKEELQRSELLAKFDTYNPLNSMPAGQKKDFFTHQIKKYAGSLVTEEEYPLLISMLDNYYMYGKSKMTAVIWDYSLSFPLNNFNKNAQTNNAYYFLLALLFCFATVGCISNIVFREDL